MIGKDNLPVTFRNIEKVTKSIEKIFPETDASEIKGLRKTYGTNWESFYIINGYLGPTIVFPFSEHEESIKERLEVLAELKFMSIN